MVIIIINIEYTAICKEIRSEMNEYEWIYAEYCHKFTSKSILTTTSGMELSVIDRLIRKLLIALFRVNIDLILVSAASS